MAAVDALKTPADITSDPLWARHLVFALSDEDRQALAARVSADDLAAFDKASSATLRLLRWIGQPTSVSGTAFVDGRSYTRTTQLDVFDHASLAAVEGSTLRALRTAEAVVRRVSR